MSRPPVGAVIMLRDGRRFVVESLKRDAFGWWLIARNHDRTLQGNFTCERTGAVWVTR